MSLASTKKTFTLGDLARIALGANKLTHVNLSVLQSLLIILLQKLNCQNESVRMHGFPAKCIQQLLNDKPQSSKYNFQFETVTKLQENYELLEQLERKTQEIEAKIERHFEKVRSYYKNDSYSGQQWDLYASPTEDLCTLYMTHNKDFCLLAKNVVFNLELTSRVMPTVVQRLGEFEAKLENMRSQLREITKVTDDANEKLNCIPFLIRDIENERSTFSRRAENFNKTMLETQEMMRCKLHRVALPSIRKYLEQLFGETKEHLRVLRLESTKCPPVKPLMIEDKKTCLSCTQHQEAILDKKFHTEIAIDDGMKCLWGKLVHDQSNVDIMERIEISRKKSKGFSEQDFRQSRMNRHKLILQSEAVLTTLTSFVRSPKAPIKESNVVSIMKSLLKKEEKPGHKSEEKNENLEKLNENEMWGETQEVADRSRHASVTDDKI